MVCGEYGDCANSPNISALGMMIMEFSQAYLGYIGLPCAQEARNSRPTDWRSAAASAPGKPSKNERSRARSGPLQCRVGRLNRSSKAFICAKIDVARMP